MLRSVILAGGEGTRLKPLTSDLPKPLAPICGSPCLYYILNLLKIHGISEAILTLRYKSEQIVESVQNIREMNIRCITEKESLGTSGSVANCKEFIDEDFLVICGDCICDFNLSDAVRFHKSHGGLATVILTKVKDPLEYGVAVSDENGCISRFIEKPSWARAYSNTVNTGIYIFSPQIFNYIPNNSPSDFSKDIFPELLRNNVKIHGYLAEGYWCDIGNINAYMQCNRDMLNGKIKYSPILSVLTNKTKTLITDSKVESPLYIGENVRTENVFLGKNSVIGKNCILKSSVRIENSILLDGVILEEGASVRDCLICSDSIIGKESSIGEKCVIGSEAVVGKDSVIAAGSIIEPRQYIPDNTLVKNTFTESPKIFENGKITFNTENPNNFFFIRIGYAFAKVIGKDIAIGVDLISNIENLSSYMMTLCGGILSTSVNMFNLGKCDINIFCDAVREYGFGGGIFLGEENGAPTVKLFEKDGLPFGRDKERSFEKAFTSDDIEHVKGGSIRPFKGYEKIYERRTTELLKNKNRLNVFLSAPDFISNKVKTTPSLNNCEYIYVMPCRLAVQSNTREAYDDDLIKCVTAFCCGMIEGEVFIPYDYPMAVDAAAKKYGFRCKRLTLEDKDRVKLRNMTDTYLRAVYLLCFMEEHGLSFGEIASMMPVFTSRRREIDVSSDKASVMYKLSSGKNRELIEGVKITEKAGTVLIIPQKNKNSFTVCAESADAETAAELCDFYTKKLKK